MNFDFVVYNKSCSVAIDQYVSTILSLLSYSHIPTALIGLFVSWFVFTKSNRSLAGKILLALSVTFAVWCFSDLVLWTSYDTRKTMFFWAPFGMLFSLLFSFSIYFAYVFFDKHDISLQKKVVIFLPSVLAMIMTPLPWNLNVFDDSVCEAVESLWYVNAYTSFGLVASLWIFGLAIHRYIKSKKRFRKQIVLFTIGLELFLFSFAGTSYISSLVGDFYIGIYGLFGMPIFMAFLAYLIVQYRAFNIRLLGAQSLVITLILLIGAQFFYVKTRVNFFLTIITFCLVILAGILLIRAFKKSESRKEELTVLTNRLAITNERLRELDDAKTEFISIASHQLRTPLTSIKGYCSLVIEGTYGPVSDQAKDVLRKVMLANDRLVGLVENLLSVSRMESGRMEYHFEKHDVVAIVSDLVELFMIPAKAKGLQLTFETPSRKIPEVDIDKPKMQEVFSNLIDNAIKYTNEGSVHVSIEDLSSVGKRLCLTVRDTGIGVPPSEIPFLFAKFSRGKDIDRLHANGTGLGLYVAKAIVEAHKGTIHIESEGEGRGTAFVVEM